MQGGGRKPFKPLTILASTVAAALLAVGVLMLNQQPSLAVAAADQVPGASLKEYAYQLFSTYLLPVQIVGFLLLISMLGVIVLSKKFDDAEGVK
jgi:NADH-quinone oxidoreductase subunit J